MTDPSQASTPRMPRSSSPEADTSPATDASSAIDPLSGSASVSRKTSLPGVDQYLHNARRIQRAARSDRASDCLPAIRRLVATDAFIPGISVVELYRRRQEVRRRHCLLVLAREAGLRDWIELRNALEHDPAAIAPDIRGTCMPASYPNLWFTTLEEALAYQAQHGGQVLRHGTQAVIVQDHETEVSSEPVN